MIRHRSRGLQLKESVSVCALVGERNMGWGAGKEMKAWLILGTHCKFSKSFWGSLSFSIRGFPAAMRAAVHSAAFSLLYSMAFLLLTSCLQLDASQQTQ